MSEAYSNLCEDAKDEYTTKMAITERFQPQVGFVMSQAILKKWKVFAKFH